MTVMTLRRLAVLSLVAAYLGVGFCREACAFDASVARPAAAVSGSGHCHEGAAAPAGRSHRAGAPCCTMSAANASALLPGQVALPSVSLLPSASVAVNAAPVLLDGGAAPRVEPRAPPGAAASVRPQAHHGPRPPPSVLA